MKKIALLVLTTLSFAQVNSTTIDYSKMSTAELNAAFVSAVRQNNSEKIQELIQAGANVNTPIPYTITSGDCDWDIESSALTYAISNNCPNIVKALLKDKQKLNENLNEALNEAIIEGYLGVVKALIEGGADINYINGDANTPLIIATINSNAYGEFSLQAQSQSRSRWRSRREIIQTLLKAGAKVNNVNKSGRTALMEAVINHDLNTVQSLLEVPEISKGSFFGLGTKPINYADNNGDTALILAVKNIRCSYINNQEYSICINSQRIIEQLLKFPGINPHHVNNNGETAITLLEQLTKQTRYY